MGRTMLQGIPTVARVRRLSGRIINVDCVERRGSTRCELPEGDSAYSEVCDTCGRRCGTSVRAGGGGRIRLIRKAVQRNWRNGGTVAGDLSGRSGGGRGRRRPNVGTDLAVTGCSVGVRRRRRGSTRLAARQKTGREVRPNTPESLDSSTLETYSRVGWARKARFESAAEVPQLPDRPLLPYQEVRKDEDVSHSTLSKSGLALKVSVRRTLQWALARSTFGDWRAPP